MSECNFLLEMPTTDLFLVGTAGIVQFGGWNWIVKNDEILTCNKNCSVNL